VTLNPAIQEVTANHLARNAYLYVRQSTIRQVFENTESTRRQYALRQRAVALGWPEERIVVIDDDQGQSGASAANRKGFQQLVAEVGMGQAGIVLGLEVSRLARNNSDWHRLLEICGLTKTLILDEDGIYDPTHFNDRLLLGLKGTMSEAELHVLRMRLRGGVLNKAQRGELQCPVPVGFTYDAEGRVVFDPDQQVQESLRLLFRTFRRTGSAMATVKEFRRQTLQFPRRLRKGPNKGELIWGALEHSRTLQILHNPRYAGAFVFGRSRTSKRVDGTEATVRLPRDQWHTLLPDVHPAYIPWQEFEENQLRLRENGQSRGTDRRSPPREGPALLQGLAVCGICGARMTTRYHHRYQQRVPDYVCQREHVRLGTPTCQTVPGRVVDEAIGELLLSTVTPMALEVSLAVQAELQSRIEEADRLRRQHVERAQYEADLARRRYLQVDPDHRLVADSLEGEWNHKLRALAEARENYERSRQKDRQVLDDAQRAKILALATDFPRLWRDPATPDRERKRMARLLLEDVTLIRSTDITLQVRFKGGATQALKRPLPLNAWEMNKTSPEVVTEIDRLLDWHTESQIAKLLNERGFRSGTDRDFNFVIVRHIRQGHGLKSRQDRLRDRGMLTQAEIAAKLGVHVCTIRKWQKRGMLRGHAYNDKGQYLYEPPEQAVVGRIKRHEVTATISASMSESTSEVQCGA